jgi:hypothetical protein
LGPVIADEVPQGIESQWNAIIEKPQPSRNPEFPEV